MVSMHEITMKEMVFTYFWKLDLLPPTPIEKLNKMFYLKYNTLGKKE